MKYSLVILSSLFFVGCVTPIGLTANYQCSSVGLKLDSVSFVDSNSHTYANANAYGRNGSASAYGTANTSTNSQGVNCVKPSTDSDIAQIKKDQKIIEPILEFNNKVPTYRVWNGLGYLYVIPGLGLWYYYGTLQDEAMAKAKEIQRGLASE